MNDEEEKEEPKPNELECLLSSIEDELNIHHGEYCEHATQADLILSFQLRKLLSCVELLHLKQTSKIPSDPESADFETSRRSFAFNKEACKYQLIKHQ